MEAPAVFLKASHVLRRQLLAFAMDSWTAVEKGKNIIPTRMQAVLDAVETADQTHFPYTVLEYINKNMEELWDTL